MSDKLKALQTAIYSAVSAAVAPTPVYDAVPPSVDHSGAFCYVTIGDLSAIDWSTKTFSGQEVACTIHVWSSYRGNKEAQEKMDLIHSALNNVPPTVTGATAVICRYESSQIFLDPDGLTRHGTMRFRVNLQHE